MQIVLKRRQRGLWRIIVHYDRTTDSDLCGYVEHTGMSTCKYIAGSLEGTDALTSVAHITPRDREIVFLVMNAYAA